MEKYNNEENRIKENTNTEELDKNKSVFISGLIFYYILSLFSIFR